LFIGFRIILHFSIIHARAHTHARTRIYTHFYWEERSFESTKFSLLLLRFNVITTCARNNRYNIFEDAFCKNHINHCFIGDFIYLLFKLLYEKNGFAEICKNLVRYKSEIIILVAEISKLFAALSYLSVLYNHFDII